MKRVCVEKKTVSRAGRPHDVCARYENRPTDDLVRADGDEKIGAYVANPLSGLTESVMDPSVLVPILVGVGGTTAGYLAARRWGSKIHPRLREWAALPGVVAGSLLSVPLAWWKGPTEAASGIVTSVLTGAAIFGIQKISGTLGGVGAYTAQRLGAYTAQQVGQLPKMREHAQMPASVQGRVKSSSRVYGRSWAS